MWMTRWARRRHVVVVRHQDDRLPVLVEVVDQVQHLGAGARIEVAGGLVGQDDERIVHQRAGDGHALLLAAGELAGPMVQPVAQADQLGQLQAVVQRCAARSAPLVEERHLDVLEHA